MNSKPRITNHEAQHYYALIMAGGSGTRFWPASRNAMPKQFLSLWNKKTLIEETCLRIQPLVPRERLEIFTKQDKVRWVSQHLKISKNQIVGEPVGRNTAPCAIWSALRVLKQNPDAVLAILPSDHFIGKPLVYAKALKTAYAVAAETGLPVTLGIQPDSPHTGYGYLEMGAVKIRQSGFAVHGLKAFHEKPDLKRAQAYLKSGKFLWNAGIFIWKAQSLVNAAEKYLPDTVQKLQKIVDGRLSAAQINRIFESVESVSIDYGLMEKLKSGILTMPVSVDWNDVGSWSTLAKLLPADKDDNILQGNVISVRGKGNFVRSGKKPIALVGVENMIVVDAGDVLLVCPKSETESIRDLVAEMKARGFSACL